MQDKMMIKQKTRELSIFLLIISIILTPLYMAILLSIAMYCKQETMRKKKFMLIQTAILTVFIVFSVLFGIPVMKWSVFSWLCTVDVFREIIACAAIMLFCVVDYSKNADDWMLENEQKKLGDSFSRTSTLNFADRTHMFVVGTTGSGKTTLLLQYIGDSLRENEPLFILSGKNGADDPFSLVNMVKQMSEYYGRELHIVSLNPKEDLREGYNPLQNMSVVELADALCNASEFTEPHYKYCLATWIKAIGECLQIMDIPFSLKAIIDFFDWESFSELLKEMREQKRIDNEQLQEYLKLEDICKTSALSRARFLNLLLGEGSEVWKDSGISAYQCRTKNAVFFCDLDSFKYSDFTDTIGKFFANDIRNVISSENDPAQRKRIIMDELSVYASEQILPLFSQSRAYGYQIIVATQSIADIRGISSEFAERILENCGQYGILQLNSAEDAETMAKIIGTKNVIETTRKSQGNFLDGSWAGSKKVVKQFKVGPDAIKELKPLEVIIYSKKEPEKVEFIKLKHVS